MCLLPSPNAEPPSGGSSDCPRGERRRPPFISSGDLRHQPECGRKRLRQLTPPLGWPPPQPLSCPRKEEKELSLSFLEEASMALSRGRRPLARKRKRGGGRREPDLSALPPCGPEGRGKIRDPREVLSVLRKAALTGGRAASAGEEEEEGGSRGFCSRHLSHVEKGGGGRRHMWEKEASKSTGDGRDIHTRRAGFDKVFMNENRRSNGCL